MEIVLRNKYKIKSLVKSITLSEALDGIAYTLELQLIETEELKKIGTPKVASIKIIDTSVETNKSIVIFDGVIWTRKYSRKSKNLILTCKERTIYIEESEDEYLFGEGTATRRIERYCKDWNIPCASLINTGVKLAKTKCRRESIFSMMLKDIKETAQKGGNLYKLRMLDRLNIIKLGSNNTIWRLETIAEDIEETSSLQGAVTQVKILGKNDKDEAKSPVIGIYKKNTFEYGTLQKVFKDSKITNGEQAKKKANLLFNTGEESVKVSCAKDINTIRSGDVVSLNGTRYYVIDITHRIESNEGMDITLGQWDYVKRRFYSGDNV